MNLSRDNDVGTSLRQVANSLLQITAEVSWNILT